MRRHPIIAALLKRHEIRKRALVIAEYMIYSRYLLSGRGESVGLSQENWIEEVKHIESHILNNEAPEVAYLEINYNWDPLEIFFHFNVLFERS